MSMIEIGLCESFISIKDKMGFVMLRLIKEGDAKGGLLFRRISLKGVCGVSKKGMCE